MNDLDIQIANLMLHIAILVNDYSTDSKASKRCFLNRLEPEIVKLNNLLLIEREIQC